MVWWRDCRKIAAIDKLFRKFKKSKLNVDEILYREARNTVQALIKDKKRKLLQEKLSFCKKSCPNKLGLPDKKAPTTSICLNSKKSWHFHPGQSQILLKKHFLNLANDLVKLPDPTFSASVLQRN